MARFARNDGYIGLAKQAAKGTGIAPAYFVKWDGGPKMTPDMDVEKLQEGGDGQYPGIMLKKKHKPDGSFDLFARPDIAGFLFAMLLGADTIAGTGPYTHTIIASAPASLPWVTVERSVAGQLIDRIIDSRIKEIKVSGEAGQPVKLAVSYLGTTEAKQATPATVTLETDDPFMFWQGTYTLDTADVSGVIPAFEITLSNIFDEDDFANAITRADIPLIRRDIKGSFRVKFENADRFAKTYFGDTSGTAPATALTTGNITIDLNYGTGAGARELKIDLQKIYHTAAKVELASKEETSQEYDCEFEGSKGTGDLVTVTAKNAKATSYVA